MDLSMISPNLDLKKIEPINQNRTLAFLNHWIHHTIIYLNQFCTVCHKKLQKIDEKIQKIDNQLAILENKLSSIPNLESETVTPIVDNTATVIQKAQDTTEVIASPGNMPNDVAPAATTSEQITPPEQRTPPQVDGSFTPVSKHPKFEKFFKMISFGVPEDAVRLKMSVEGLDPNVLRNPNAAAPIDEESASKPSDSDTSWDE